MSRELSLAGRNTAVPCANAKPDCICALRRKRRESLPVRFSGTLSPVQGILVFSDHKSTTVALYRTHAAGVLSARSLSRTGNFQEVTGKDFPCSTKFHQYLGSDESQGPKIVSIL